jgi:hypothetical protein
VRLLNPILHEEEHQMHQRRGLHRVAVAVMLVTVAVIGVSAPGPAGAQDAPIGVWQGVDDADGSVVTVAFDDDDVGNVIVFLYDSISEDCSGQQGVTFGRGQSGGAPGEALWHFPYEGLYCSDGTFVSVPEPDNWYELIAPAGGGMLMVLTAAQATDQEPGGVAAFPVCDPDTPVPEGWNVVMGTEEDDTIKGTKAADLICGMGGEDTIRGFGGDDIIIGGDGGDEVYGGTGMDVIWGGVGGDVLYGGFHTDGVFGGDGDDEVRPQASADFGYGGYGADILDGFFGHDRLEGGPGDDDAWGRNGNDYLLGGTGDDFLSGGAGGGDTVDGEAGSDTCNAETETNCES